jgi:hypothetical protein
VLDFPFSPSSPSAAAAGCLGHSASRFRELDLAAFTPALGHLPQGNGERHAVCKKGEKGIDRVCSPVLRRRRQTQPPLRTEKLNRTTAWMLIVILLPEPGLAARISTSAIRAARSSRATKAAPTAHADSTARARHRSAAAMVMAAAAAAAEAGTRGATAAAAISACRRTGASDPRHQILSKRLFLPSPFPRRRGYGATSSLTLGFFDVGASTTPQRSTSWRARTIRRYPAS